MSDVFTLDTLREQLEEKYGSFKVGLSDGDVAEFQNAMRLPKAKRVGLMKAMKDLEVAEDGEELDEEAQLEAQEAAVKKVIELAVKDGKGKKVIKEVGDDLVFLIELINQWQEQTQLGEASNSAD